MSVDTIEREDSPTKDAEPGSGIGVAMPNYTQEHMLSLLVSRVSKQNDDTSVVQSKADGESLSAADRQALFASLQKNLERPENCEDTTAQWDVIEQALLRDPRMMRNLKKLQDHGADLVVTEFQEGRYVEFADAAVNLDVAGQETALAGMTQQEKNDAIAKILQLLEDKESARHWILLQLHRPEGARGLNWVEALLYAVHHGGRLILYGELDAMARRNSSVVENRTTWYFGALLKVMESGVAPRGYRNGGVADRCERYTDLRDDSRGVRVAGLRVQLTP